MNKQVNPAAYTLFDTKLGQCGLVWRRARQRDAIVVTGFQLPEATEQLMEARIVGRWKANRTEALPVRISDIIERVKLHFEGQAQDFRDIELEFDGISSFANHIYDVARTILPGETMTYRKVAEAAGYTGAARAVGLAMSRNPVPLIIPCHRVLAAGSKPGGFSAHGGLATKARMLDIEGVPFGRPATIRSERHLRRIAPLLAKQDPRLASVLSQPIDFKLMQHDSPYHTLVTAVVHQQLSPKAAKTILDRITALNPGSKLPKPTDLIKTPDVQLRGAGLSLSKIKAIKDIAARTIDGTVPSKEEIVTLSDGEIIRRLTSIFGVGQWTVEMMLIFNLGRIDALPGDDYSLRKSIADVLGMKTVPAPKEVRKIGEAWRPYRTVASLYLWNATKGNCSSE